MTAAPATIGSNLGPASEYDALRIRLAETHALLTKRADELLSAEERLPAIADDATAGNVADYIKQIAAATKALDGARVAEKEPFLEGGRTVDGWAKRLTDPLSGLKSRVERKLGVYLREKADRERREREEIAKLAREEEDRKNREALEAMASAAPAQAEAATDAAMRAQADTAKAEKSAEAKPAEMARTRGDQGALGTLQQIWTFDGLDRDALDIEALRQHIPIAALETGLRAFIKAGGRTIKGARIFQDTKASVR